MRPLLRIVLCAALCLAPACSSDNPAGPDVTNPDKIAAVIEEAGYLMPAANNSHNVTPAGSEDEGDYRYHYEKHDVVENNESVAYLGLNDDIIWPGSLIKGNRAHSFIYAPVSVERAPVTLSISLETSPSTGSSLTEVVKDPKLSTIRQGINNLMKKAITQGTTVPAQVDFDYRRVYNESHMSLYVGADVSYGLGDLKTAFDWESTTKQTKIVAKYQQIYYSIDMDSPQSPAALFPQDISLDALRTAMPAGSMPLYVAGVKYGWMAIMTIETSYSEEKMSLALDYAYGGKLDLKVDSDLTAREMMENSSIRIAVYGGSTAGLQDIMRGLDGFQSIVDASHNFGPDTPGVPLVYKFRHPLDNELALITMTSQYTLIRPQKIKQRVKITATSLECTAADDGWFDSTLEVDKAYVKIWAWDRKNTTEVGYLHTDGQYVWSYDGADHDMRKGDTWGCPGNNSITVSFNNVDFDFDAAKIKFEGYVRDDDDTGDDWATDTYEILGRDFLDEGGVHIFKVDKADHFSFNYKMKLEFVD